MRRVAGKGGLDVVKYIFAFALLAGAAATPAFAQADPEPFTGFRVEAFGGFDTANYNRSGKDQGIVYGAGIGYDFAVGGFRIGVEAEGSDSTTDGCVQLGLDRFCTEAGRDLYAGGRIGFAAGSKLLLYAKGGYTNLRLTRRDHNPLEGPIVLHPKFDGVRFGGGAELAVGASSFVKAEYRYSDYDRRISFDRHQGVVGFGLRF